MTVYIFAGPTLSHGEIAAELDAVCLPPVSQGDVYRASLEEPWAIGIIDGYFERVPSVWHKEILWALSRGIHVFGAASMGALRAAELASFGMVGVGRIFEDFRDGRLTDDDEVTVIHGDAESGYRPLSTAMVDLRGTLALAVQAGLLTEEERRTFEDDLKRRYYADRSDAALVADVRARLAPERAAAIEAWLPAGRVSQKRSDALAMIRTMREWRERQEEARPAEFHFEHTDAWDQVSQRSGRQVAAALPDELPFEWLLDELRLDRDRFASVENAAFARVLALAHAERQGVSVDTARFRHALDEFRRDRELVDGTALTAWLESQDLDRDTFAGLIHDDAQVRWTRTVCAPEIRRCLIDELRLSGAFGPLARRARDKAQWLSARGLDNPALDSAPIDLAALLGWFFVEERGQAVPPSLELHARNHGYRDRDTFIQAILREYYYSRRQRQQ